MLDSRLVRLDETRVRVKNPHGVEAILFANEQVPVETAAVTELLGLLELQRTVEQVYAADPHSFEATPAIDRVAVTPDFHKGRGIPVGTVLATRGFLVPQAIGNDIGCGMRLHATSLDADRMRASMEDIEKVFRRIFFAGGRNIPMNGKQRYALLTEGLAGLLNATPRTMRDGIWSVVHDLRIDRDLDRVERRGSLPARRVLGLTDFIGDADQLSRDSQIGSIGGGNHFLEIQRVERVLEGPTAHAWGLKPGTATIMVHTGSVSIGNVCGIYYQDLVRGRHPKSVRYPENGVFILPEGGAFRDTAELFWDAMHNAANFSFANRMFLALHAISGLREVFGDFDCRLVYDAAHNLVWSGEEGGVSVHRKGACPARGFEQMIGTPFEYFGEPVLVPGSMGASSFVLAGRGNPEALWSASHGAGRQLSRGDALRVDDAAFEEFLRRFRIVTAFDLRSPQAKLRPDILQRKLDDIKQEAPFAYKGIGPVVQTLSHGGIAVPVAELSPILTIKG